MHTYATGDTSICYDRLAVLHGAVDSYNMLFRYDHCGAHTHDVYVACSCPMMLRWNGWESEYDTTCAYVYLGVM